MSPQTQEPSTHDELVGAVRALLVYACRTTRVADLAAIASLLREYNALAPEPTTDERP